MTNRTNGNDQNKQIQMEGNDLAENLGDVYEKFSPKMVKEYMYKEDYSLLADSELDQELTCSMSPPFEDDEVKEMTREEKIKHLEDALGDDNDRIPDEEDIIEILADYSKLLSDTDQHEKSQAVMNMWANLETWGMRK